MLHNRCTLPSQAAAGITKSALNLARVQWKNENRILQTQLNSSQGCRNYTSLPKQFLEDLKKVKNAVLSESAFSIIWNRFVSCKGKIIKCCLMDGFLTFLFFLNYVYAYFAWKFLDF